MTRAVAQLKLVASALTLRPKLVDEYRVDETMGVVIRRVRTASGTKESIVPLAVGAPRGDGEGAFDWSWLRMRTMPESLARTRVRIADVFAGCGQLSLGAIEGCRSVGRRGEVAFALDVDCDAATMCKRLFPDAWVSQSPIEKLVGGRLGAQLSSGERTTVKRLGTIDILVGGPPCQGHSDLNNHTRRYDERNGLGFRMVRMAEILHPAYVVIENVRGIVRDRGHVFSRMREGLERLGYRTADGVVRAEVVGVPQRRRRMFLIASLNSAAHLEAVLNPELEGTRDFAWACGDLERVTGLTRHDTAPSPSPTNAKRIQYLFAHDLFDLPNPCRPLCHRGEHSYKSIYGRMRWNEPAQTITTGFRCMGQGRFVHPRAPRTITPHEAARLQFIPDFVNFKGVADTSVARLIGNAVPPKISWRIVQALLRVS
jgi:DNA (cytosine-5)-methyltransferase 1